MWPIKLDMTRDECRGVLRRLELESYSSVMSTFRAQGGLCKEKARILEDLRKLLHISQDRHKAEARRVANDERLTTVAEIISGPNSVQDWCREGHRTFPILPRTAPYTALTYIANTVCEQITRENAKLPHPFETSKNRLQKEQEEEEKQKALEQQKLQEQSATTSAAVPKTEVEPQSATPLVVAPEPVKQIQPPPPPLVVMLDPFIEAANKSYINNDLKRSYPEEPNPTPSIANTVEDDSPLKKKPQLYQELQKQEPSFHPPPIVTFHTQPYTPLQPQLQQPPLHFPLPQQLLSPNKNLPSPNNFGPVLANNNLNINANNNNILTTKPTKASTKNTERQRKTSGSSRKNQNKTKTPYQTKQSAKAAKNMAQQQQQQQQQQLQPQQPVTIQSKMPAVSVGTGPIKGTNSPHLIHSYASPLVPYEIPQHPGSLEMPDLQKHLTSNIVYQTQGAAGPQPPNYGVISTAVPVKSPSGPYQVQQQQGQPNSGQMPTNIVFGPQHILPSSKKDIQYNLTKLNPTHSGTIKNNVNIPLKPASPSIIHGKGHPLLNYQKKSPSKNVLIPTSSAAATLASLGIPKTIQRKDSVSKARDSDLIINPADIPNPKIIFSTSAPTTSHQGSPSHIPPGNQITILDQITLHPPNTIIQASTSGGVTIIPSPASQQTTISHIAPHNPTALLATNNTMAPKPVVTPITPVGNKVVTFKGPNLAGFTPVKSGSKLSVHKLQLMPIAGPTGSKNNVIVLPAKSAGSGTLNPGQKITIPKSVVETNALMTSSGNLMSPPKVIVQQQPDLNNIVVLDIGADQKFKATSKPSNKSVITEDTPVDIVSTPIDVVTGAVKLQELSKAGFLSSASTSSTSVSSVASPLTDKMIKPTGKYNNSANLTKPTKFEADSTAPGPSVNVTTKKSKVNHQGRTVQNSKSKSKPTPAAASSTTAGADAPQSRTPATDWELELDQANQAHNFKSNNVLSKPAHKPTPKSNPPTVPTPIAPKPIIATTPNSSNFRKSVQPLSSSSISSTSTPIASEAARLPLHRPTVPVPVPVMTTPPPKASVPLPVGLLPTTSSSPPNERSDDTSATDSADAEEEEPDECEETIGEDLVIIDDDEHFHEVIEEDPEVIPDETFNEHEDIHGERVEIVSVGYDTSRALIADLEGADGTGSPVIVQEGATIVYDKAGNGNVEINPSSMNFEQYIEEAGDGDDEGEPVEVDARRTALPGAVMAGSNSSNKNIMFEMMEIDADGNKHTRTVSYEEALAEGQIMAASEKPVKHGSTSVTGTVVKGKTKPTS
ncbi:hypothetical protein RP20_CCG019902 [Aedes albopictus]|nr:hypothetical protein RP20_CCG019902 [Aedes albopictus]